MKKNLIFKSLLSISILYSLVFSFAFAATQKTEKIGKVSPAVMPEGVSLKWDDPSGFDKVVVVKNSSHLPENSSDGTVIYEGKGTSYMDKDLSSGATYYYAVIFVPQKVTYQQKAIQIVSKPVEIIQELPPPAKVTVVSTSMGSQILLFFGMFDSVKDFWFSIIRALQALIIFLGLRSGKKNGWGLVYDWETKEPLKNIILSLINERKEKIASVISDEAGRFGFLVEEGNYFLEVGKHQRYKFSPEMYTNEDIYGNVYKGKELAVKNEELVALNVPLQATVPRSEIEQKKKFWKLDFTKMKSNKIVNFIIEFSFWIGFIFITISLWTSFSIFKLLLAAFYVLVFFMRLYLLRAIRKWGIVLSSKNKKPVPFAVVRAFKGAEKEQAGVSVSNTKGGFYMLVPSDSYEVSIKGRTLEGENFDKETIVTAKKGLINGVYYI